MSPITANSAAAPHADEDMRPPTQLALALEDMRDLKDVTLRTLYYTFRGRPNRKHVVEQMFHIGNQSVFFMSITMAFIGAIIGFQMCLQNKRILPDLSLIGGMYIKLLLRELAPSVGAMPLATRVGAGIAAEIGSMVVTDQTDALRMCAADPVEYLVVPRFIASVVMGTIVLLLGGGVMYFAGALVAHGLFDVSYHQFFKFHTVKWDDVVLCFLKCLSFGGCMAVVSAQRGLRTFGGSEGVGIATTQAVVGSLFAIIMLDFALSAFGYVFLPG